MAADEYMHAQGYVRVNFEPTTSTFDPDGRGWGTNGIDHIWYKPDTGKFVIADSKVNTAELAQLTRGEWEMSETWINDNLEGVVSFRVEAAIVNAGGPGSIDRVVFRFETDQVDAAPLRFHRVQTPTDVDTGLPLPGEVLVRTRTAESDWSA